MDSPSGQEWIPFHPEGHTILVEGIVVHAIFLEQIIVSHQWWKNDIYANST
jgi:hypothetical protein